MYCRIYLTVVFPFLSFFLVLTKNTINILVIEQNLFTNLCLISTRGFSTTDVTRAETHQNGQKRKMKKCGDPSTETVDYGTDDRLRDRDGRLRGRDARLRDKDQPTEQRRGWRLLA